MSENATLKDNTKLKPHWDCDHDRIWRSRFKQGSIREKYVIKLQIYVKTLKCHTINDFLVRSKTCSCQRLGKELGLKWLS